MLVIFPFSIPDQAQALKNAKWIAELGDCKGHDIFILSDKRCDMDTVKEAVATLSGVFKIVQHRWTKTDIDGWPEGANHMFGYATALIQHTKEWPYFLWMEPDAIPLTPGWLDKLEAEYKRAGKPFMGDRVQVEDIPLHMSGVGIYQNPIYLLAGEAYRAHDTAWDMAAKDQIVPNAHFTTLIEHAWQHPTFKDQSEINTQIAKETILFHSSKDGSLIDLLRQKRGRNQSTEACQLAPNSVLPTKEPDSKPGSPSPPPIYDIFIRTYPGDYQWLAYCVLSIHKFCTGFRKIWVVSPGPKPDTVRGIDEWKVVNDETEDGYLAQQITKLYADVVTDYQADYILHVDSDVIFTRPTTPGDFFKDGKMIWYYTPYEAIQTPWQPVTEKFMGFHQPYEFMRRLPMMVPRWLYPLLREFAYHLHSVPICDYIKMQPQRAFSEFNAIGAYAYFHHKDKFYWQHTQEEGSMPAPLARQFHSWSGITDDVKAEIEGILGGMEVKDPKDAPSVPSQIKVLPSGVWVMEGDQISQWVEQEGRLDHDQNILPSILAHINKGDTVVDAGAFIGDHTIAYARAVGEEGKVYAFEPNEMAFECLAHNVMGLTNVCKYHHGLSDKQELVPLSGNNGNWGGAYVGDHMKVGDVELEALETVIPWRVDFIKIDVEGYELKVLRGAGNLINRCKPKMVVEINSRALLRQGSTPNDILMWLEAHAYKWSIIQENCAFTDPLYDILCVPTQPPENIKSDSLAHTHESSPVALPICNREDAQLYVDRLSRFSMTSPQNKATVMQLLVYAKLRPSNKETKSNGRKSKAAKTTNWIGKQTPKKHPA